MIIPSTKKILIVPEFGGSADDEVIVALKEAIDADWNFNAKIVDLRQMVIEENPGEGIRDSEVIELAARKLEELANDKTIVWDKPEDCADDPFLDRYLDDDDFDCSSFEEEDCFKDCDTDTAMQEEPESYDTSDAPFRKLPMSGEDVQITKEMLDKALRRRLRIRKTVTNREELDADEPDVLVVFGKSVMLAGRVKDKPILFINPSYDSEWPWKKQYYADRDAASDYMGGYFEELNKPEDTQVLWVGSEVRRRPEPIMRYGLFTDADNNYYSEFRDRYVNMAIIDERLRHTEQLVKSICEFAGDDMEFPLFDIYRMYNEGYWTSKYPEICRFEEPVNLGYATVIGLERGVPMANGQSGIKLRVADRSYLIPLEGIRDRKGLTTLRDAVSKEVEKLPQRKRILIVPDYFTPYNAPNVIELRDRLRCMGYYVAVFVAGNTLEQSQRGIERRCKKKPFDLVVTLEIGCLLASRIINAPRVFVNPDWAAWEWMKLRIDEERELQETRGLDDSGPFWSYKLNAEEVEQARKMAEHSFIRKGKHCVFGWFSEDSIEGSLLTEEHMKRFNICAYIPGLRLDTDGGITVLARQIDNILKTEDEN